MQMTNGGSDARLDAVDLENMLCSISDHSAVPGNSAICAQITLVGIESPKAANRIKSPIASSQIKSFGAWIESQYASNRDLNRITIWFCPPLIWTRCDLMLSSTVRGSSRASDNVEYSQSTSDHQRPHCARIRGGGDTRRWGQTLQRVFTAYWKGNITAVDDMNLYTPEVPFIVFYAEILFFHTPFLFRLKFGVFPLE